MMEPFVSWPWVRERLPELYLADVRWHLDGGGYEEYLAAHLPGAVFIDLDRDLSAITVPEEGRHPLPSAEQFATTLRRVGIDGSRPVIAYDSEGGVAAARLVWMLRLWGFQAALLDGGLSDVDIPLVAGATCTSEPAPQAANSDAESARTTPEPAGSHEAAEESTRSQSPSLQPAWPAERLADSAVVEDIALQPGGHATVLIDARPRERYAGEDSTDAKAGHIPTAKSVPCREHVTASGHLRSRDELQANFAAAGVHPETDVISYCGSGVTGCHNALVMEHLGYRPARLYPGSFSAWAARGLPVEQS
ncbi:MAG: sulfurtransferase [Bowdeniella nasicola]|nr:sulfurtransferase [Bowdeniella nasicola]